jgi:hypothetical protein
MRRGRDSFELREEDMMEGSRSDMEYITSHSSPWRRFTSNHLHCHSPRTSVVARPNLVQILSYLVLVPHEPFHCVLTSMPSLLLLNNDLVYEYCPLSAKCPLPTDDDANI